MSDFEREIERELHRALDPTLADSIPAWRTPTSGSITRRLLGGAGVAIGVKLLTGIAVAAAAATIAGAATETAITGSLSPGVWGQQVKLQVEACKDRLAAGHHGIGECVSDFATKQPETVSDTAQPSAAAEIKAPADKKPAPPAQGSNNDAGHPDGTRRRPGAPSTQAPPAHDSDHRSGDRSGSFVFVRPTPRS
jgi:hypothetical protein